MTPLNGLHLLMTLRLWEDLTPERIREWLTATPAAIGMMAITAPSVAGGVGELRGFILIAQSHLSLHQEGLVVFADTFSCFPFDEQKVLKLTAEILRAKLIDHTSICRGSERSD